jgi:hypothetical protein
MPEFDYYAVFNKWDEHPPCVRASSDSDAIIRLKSQFGDKLILVYMIDDEGGHRVVWDKDE